MTAHNHAALMAQYAEDALETDAPWERWEQGGTWIWETCRYHPSWLPGQNYRRKPHTININGFEVPEPCIKSPELCTSLWKTTMSGRWHFLWANTTHQKEWLRLGIVHLTKEAAELHAKALLSFTQEQSE